MRDYQLRLTLIDESDKPVASADAGPLGTDRWIAGETYKSAKQIAFENTAVGDYRLCLSLIDPKDGRTIGLPLKDRPTDGAYLLGNIRLR